MIKLSLTFDIRMKTIFTHIKIYLKRSTRLIFQVGSICQRPFLEGKNMAYSCAPLPSNVILGYLRELVFR